MISAWKHLIESSAPYRLRYLDDRVGCCYEAFIEWFLYRMTSFIVSAYMVLAWTAWLSSYNTNIRGCTSFAWFMLWLKTFRSEKTPFTAKRLIIIIEYLTFEVFRYTCRGLYENHKFLLMLFLTLKKDLQTGYVHHNEFQVLIKGNLTYVFSVSIVNSHRVPISKKIILLWTVTTTPFLLNDPKI